MREDYETFLEAEYRRAEEATGGVLVRAESRSVTNGFSLFSGSESFAYKHASEELVTYWMEHPRVSLTAFETQWLYTHGFSA